ncbi:MAG: response regulator transcription factor [Clostridia bacterium]|nr:response regulator transcription factor [Clostridia bacterium]
MRLLLAEDEKALSSALVTILKHNNYAVDAVFNGADALAYLETGVYDGVILDIMMPHVDGLSVLKEIRRKGSRLPVMILTAKSEVDDKVAGLDYGADDYMTKPFSAKELLARLRAMLRRGDGSGDDNLYFGNVRLNRLTCELIGNNCSFRLASKEFQIMEMLMRSPSNVISTERFMEKIWGYDSDAELSVVWVYVSYLRKKLNALGANVKIKANRNIGYYLEKTDDK